MPVSHPAGLDLRGNLRAASAATRRLWHAQTPQNFRYDRILETHGRHDSSDTDQVAVARETGLDVRPVSGSDQTC
ncbi:2-C-methyl-D-erythritol 4-phosphate cytidylyltransferase [Maliponia aquimaris]|uniref:2-C-methyl-D-erythritol 4-phosphate cytidylyltransferase n=1 Tax=Maliponia aquimaris TaxID=1673631 RepID=UPI00351FB281